MPTAAYGGRTLLTYNREKTHTRAGPDRRVNVGYDHASYARMDRANE